MILPALSYKQPWCEFMLPTSDVPRELWKDIENRCWGPTTVRGATLMVASAGMTKPYYYAACDLAIKCGFPRDKNPPMDALKLGGILGALEFVDVNPPSQSAGRWHFTGNDIHTPEFRALLGKKDEPKQQYGIRLGKKCALPFRPYKGRQGFYDIELLPEEERALRAAGMLL